MIQHDILLFSQRHPVRAQIALLGYPIDNAVGGTWSLAEALAAHSGAPHLLIVDILRLLSTKVTFLPRLTRMAPNVLVVGLQEDSRELIVAWSEGVPALPIEALRLDILMRMLAAPRDGSGFYDYLGRLGAERVHSFLARRLERQILTGREENIVELLRLGWRYARIASYLGLETQTVKNYASRIYEKLGVSGRYDLMARAAEHPSAMPCPSSTYVTPTVKR